MLIVNRDRSFELHRLKTSGGYDVVAPIDGGVHCRALDLHIETVVGPASARAPRLTWPDGTRDV